MRINYLYVFILSFVLGVALYSLFNFGIYFVLFVALISVSVFSFYKFSSKQKTVFLVSLVFFAMSLGMFRVAIYEFQDGYDKFDIYENQKVSLEGIVVEEPDERERNTRLTVATDTSFGEELEQSIKVLVVADRYPEFHYGDRIKFEGKLNKPKNFENENGREFDYISYLSKDDIYYIISFPTVELLSKNHGNPVKSGLFKIKQSFLSKVSELIPDPHVSLLGGLVVGAKQSLGEELQDDFRKTGIIHIVVLSGYNVTIVAEAIMRFFSFLPHVAGISLGVISIVFFAILTGGSATIVRASIMALIVVLARSVGRTNNVTRALFIAGFFMVLHNPKIVIFDPSFQLSFLATIGLIYVAPLIEKYFHLLPTKFELREFAIATISTQIFVLPLLLYMMGELSLVALPVNLLVLMFIPITMLVGFLTSVVGFVSSVLALPFAFVSYWLLAYELKVVDLFASLPFASISISYFPLWLMFALYVVYGLVIFKLYKKIKTTKF